MIARKITYRGSFNDQSVGMFFDISRKNEITGIVKRVSENEIVLNLEGDPSQIKLIQHQIEHKLKPHIQSKNIETIPYHYYKGLDFEY